MPFCRWRGGSDKALVWAIIISASFLRVLQNPLSISSQSEAKKTNYSIALASMEEVIAA